MINSVLYFQVYYVLYNTYTSNHPANLCSNMNL